MAEEPKQENLGGQPEEEQSMEAILDALELAFEKGAKAELTVLEPGGELRTNVVFIEGLEGGVLFVAASKDSPVMPVEISNVKKVELSEKENE